MSWWNLSPCSSLTAPRFGGKKLRWNGENESWVTFGTPYPHKILATSQYRLGNLVRCVTKEAKLLKISILQHFSDLRSDKDALFELSSTKTWEHSRQVLEGSTIFLQRLHEILHQTKLDVKRRKKHFIHVHQRILLEVMFARNKSTSRPPVFLHVMLGYNSTIPETSPPPNGTDRP